MFRLSTAAAVLYAVVALSTAVCAQSESVTVRWKEYLHPKKPEFRAFNMLYLNGVKDGLISHEVVSDAKMFCLPGKLALTVEQADDIMKRFAAKQTQNINETPISLILLGGLRQTFPCP
jgi:Rap1a immunity proteins